MLISAPLNCNWAPNISPYQPLIKPTRMVSNKLREARAFKAKMWKGQVFGTCLPAVSSGRLRRLPTQTSSWRQRKTVAGSGLGLPRMIICLSLNQQGTLGKERKIAQQQDIPSLALAGLLGITLIPALLGVASHGERRGARTWRLTHRGWRAYSQWPPAGTSRKWTDLYGPICLVLFAAQGTENSHALQSLN